MCSLAGCSRFERSRQCNGYARLVNHALEEIEAEHRRPPSAAGYERIAERYDRLAKDLEQVRPGDPALAQVLSEYRNLYRQTTTNVRQAALLTAKPAPVPALSRERNALENLKRQDRALAQRFEATCRGP